MEDHIINLLEKRIEKFVESRRPPLEIRDKLDLGYSFKDNLLELFEIRPKWDDPTVILNSPFAKARYIKSKGIWKLYWMRASGKWEHYPYPPEVKDMDEVLELISQDQHGCFWG